MTAQPHQRDPAPPQRDLAAIRAALTVPEDLEAIDAGLATALHEVRVTLDLTKLNDFIHHWWIIAGDAANDSQGRQRMHDTARRILNGEPVSPGRPWQEVIAEREAQLRSEGRWVHKLTLEPVVEEQSARCLGKAHPPPQRFAAQRMKARASELDASHAVAVSRSGEVYEVIADAGGSVREV